MARGKREEPKASVEPAGLAPIDGMVGVRATRDYDNSHTGYMRRGQRTSVPVDVAKQVMADNPENPPLELVEYTEEEKAEIEKALVSPETKALGSPEKK